MCSELTGLPERLWGLTGLRVLDRRGCSGLTGLPESLEGRTWLQTINLELCSGLTELLESLGGGLLALNLPCCWSQEVTALLPLRGRKAFRRTDSTTLWGIARRGRGSWRPTRRCGELAKQRCTSLE
jgi:hypothetical protein